MFSAVNPPIKNADMPDIWLQEYELCSYASELEALRQVKVPYVQYIR